MSDLVGTLKTGFLASRLILSNDFSAEIITYYLATHCMLAHNEAKQNIMIRKYEEAVKLLPEMETAGLERFTADKSMREDCCKSV